MYGSQSSLKELLLVLAHDCQGAEALCAVLVCLSQSSPGPVLTHHS